MAERLSESEEQDGAQPAASRAREPAGQGQNSGFLEMLMRAVERSNDVVLITEADPYDLPGPRVVYVNPAFERMTGYAAEEIVGKTPRILQGPKTDREVLDRIRKALKAWEPIREEMVNYRKDGSEFVVELSMVPVANERSWYTHWFAIQRDTTEQHKLRKALRANNVLLRTVTESVPQLLWTADGDGRREWVSDRFADFVGAQVGDCLGDGWAHFVHPDDRKLALAGFSTHRGPGKSRTAEFRLRHRMGHYVWYLNQAAPRYAADGSVWKWIGSLTDISERKAAEDALRTSEERLLLTTSMTKLVIADIDYTRGLHRLTAEGARMFGLGSRAMTVARKEVHQTFHPDDAAELYARIEASHDPRGKGWFEMDHRVVWPDGTVHWLRIRKQIFFEGEGDGRRATRATLGALEITDSKLAEAARSDTVPRRHEVPGILPQ